MPKAEELERFRMATRTGHIYYTKFREIYRCVKVVPIRPKGWVIFHDEQLAYRGLVFCYKDAMQIIDEVRQRFLSNIQIHGPKQFIFKELTDVLVPVIDAPKGVFLPESSEILDKIAQEQDSLDSSQRALPMLRPVGPPPPQKPKPVAAPRSVLKKGIKNA